MNFFNDLADFSIAEIKELITLARRLEINLSRVHLKVKYCHCYS